VTGWADNLCNFQTLCEVGCTVRLDHCHVSNQHVCLQLSSESRLEPDPYVVLRLGNQSRQTREKEASTNPTWEEQFSLLCDDPTIAELNVSVSHAVCGFFTHSHHCDHVIVIVLCDRCRRWQRVVFLSDRL